jgi:hypothetical protein
MTEALVACVLVLGTLGFVALQMRQQVKRTVTSSQRGRRDT